MTAPELLSKAHESPQRSLPTVHGCFCCGGSIAKSYRGASRRWWDSCERHRRSVAMRASWDRRRHGMPGRYRDLDAAGYVH